MKTEVGVRGFFLFFLVFSPLKRHQTSTMQVEDGGWGGRRIGGPRGGWRRRPRCSRVSVRTRHGPCAAGVCRCHQGDDGLHQRGRRACTHTCPRSKRLPLSTRDLISYGKICWRLSSRRSSCNKLVCRVESPVYPWLNIILRPAFVLNNLSSSTTSLHGVGNRRPLTG